MPDEPLVVLTLREFKANLLAAESEQMVEMARRWLQIEERLEAQISMLARELADLQARGEVVELWRLTRIDRYRALLAEARFEFGRYADYADDLIAGRQLALGEQGIAHATQAIRMSYIQAGRGVGIFFDELPVAAIENMIGLAGNGSPLRRLLMEAWPDGADGMTRALIEGTALGMNPRDVARQMRSGLSHGLDRVLNIARTEQLRVYREASRMAYQASGLVSGYRRLAAHDERVCPACIALDGQIYDTDELMELHPSDRCAMVPIVAGLPQLQWQAGDAWLSEQPEEVQRSILGPGRFDLYSSGQVSLDAFASTSEHPEWGPTVRVTPIEELTGG